MKSAPARLMAVSCSSGHGGAVDPAPLGGGLDHGVLAGHVVGGHGHVDRGPHVGDHVEVGEGRLDHHHVGPLVDVGATSASASRRVAGVLLVALAVAAAGDA